MADSIQEQIIKKVSDVMAAITVANGYNNTIEVVQRLRATGVSTARVPTIVIYEGDCAVDLPNSTHQRVRRKLELYLVAVTGQEETDAAPSGAELLNSLIADMELAVGENERWDGLALMTDPPDYQEWELDAVDPHLARGLRTVITYEHERGDPWGA